MKNISLVILFFLCEASLGQISLGPLSVKYLTSTEAPPAAKNMMVVNNKAEKRDLLIVFGETPEGFICKEYHILQDTFYDKEGILNEGEGHFYHITLKVLAKSGEFMMNYFSKTSKKVYAFVYRLDRREQTKSLAKVALSKMLSGDCVLASEE